MNSSAAEIADAVHPAEQHDVLADVVGAQRAAGVGSSQVAKRFSHVIRAVLEFERVSGQRSSSTCDGRADAATSARGDRLSARPSADPSPSPRRARVRRRRGSATNGTSRADAYLNCLPSLSGFRDRPRRAARRARSSAASRSASASRLVVEKRHHHVDGRRCDASPGTCRARSSRRGSARGRARSRTPARLARGTCRSGCRSGRRRRGCRQIGHGDLHDRAGVVRQPARQARIDADARRALASPSAELDDRRRARRPPSAAACVADERSRSSRPAIGSPSPRSLERSPDSASAPPPSAMPRAASSVATPSRADLVQLVERDQRVAVQRRRHAGGVEQRRQQLAMIQPDRRSRRTRASRSTSLTAAQQLRLDDRRRRADRVDVALIELAEAAARRPVGAPHRLNLVALEELRQLALILRDHARERHGQVVAQREVGLAADASCSPRFRILKMSLLPSSPYLPSSVSMFSNAGVSSGSKP